METSLRALLVERAVVSYTLALGGVPVSFGTFVLSMKKEGVAVRFRGLRGVAVENACVDRRIRRNRTPGGPPPTDHREPPGLRPGIPRGHLERWSPDRLGEDSPVTADLGENPFQCLDHRTSSDGVEPAAHTLDQVQEIRRGAGPVEPVGVRDREEPIAGAKWTTATGGHLTAPMGIGQRSGNWPALRGLPSHAKSSSFGPLENPDGGHHRHPTLDQVVRTETVGGSPCRASQGSAGGATADQPSRPKSR